ncbi:capsular polysaccharide export protein, LipB/KpsS family [Halalkalibacter alkalisediminis]|uniref:Spore coat protein n=1 Tax=Halalkalibacter alkalisediminis TaxID=935616 RepID=A0ABV6NPP2_9BACI|nr:hypothetical protein [Halalkalibacter alkalisediminis]
MDFHLKYYWSLYLEFIEVFKELNYKGILLPILLNFSELIKENVAIQEEMKKAYFLDNLKNKIYLEKQIQPYFDQYKPFRRNSNVPAQKMGKVLLYEYVLRFPYHTLKNNFNPKNTIILRKERKMGTSKLLPTYFLDENKSNISALIKKMQVQAKDIFSSSSCHPVFKNIDFQERFNKAMPPLLNDLVTIGNFFNKVPISCVVVGTTEDPQSRSIVAVASTKGIPSICMQHGLIIREDGYLPVISTKQAVYGEFEKKWYLSKGVSESQIEIVGHPRFDEIFTKQFSGSLQRELNLNIEKKRVLLATQPSDRSKWGKLINHLIKDPSIEVIIKPHPLEINNKDYLYYKMLSSKYRRVKLILNKKLHLYDVLSNVNVVVVSASTVGLEGMLFGKPVAVLKGTATNYYNSLGDFVQSDPSILAKKIKRVLNEVSIKKRYEKRRKEFISYAYPQKYSVNRLLKLMDKLINEN